MTWQLDIENIRGIRTGSAEIDPGVNALRAENWQGKSSLLAAIKTAMGIDTALMEGADSGEVTLRTESDTYSVELRREDGSVVRSGTPYLEAEYDQICADLFAALDETNDVRRAVRDRENLESILTYPLDFENIDQKIAERQRERDSVETELERARAAAEKLPEVTERVTELESQLEELRDRRESLDSPDTDETLSEKRDRLSDIRAKRNRLTERIERLENSVERTTEKLEEKRAELDSLTVPDAEDIEAELEAVQEEFDVVERDRNLLQGVYTANKRVVDEGRVDLLTDVDRGLLEDSMICWVCESEADLETVRSQLEGLREKISTLQSKEAEYRDRIDELQDRRDAIEAKREQKRDLETEIPRLEGTLSDRKESLESSQERLAELDERIDELEDSVDEIDETRTDLESEIKYKQSELEEARAEQAELEAESERREELEEKRDSITAEIDELRARKDTVKRETREAFDEAIKSIIERFDTGFESARLTAGFDLVVARQGREASLDALSQGELELLGIVAALAGHEAYGVGAVTPVLLLDDLGRLSDKNVDQLVAYLSDRAKYLVFTSYPEHSAFEGTEITLEDWSVISEDDEARTTA